MHLKGNHPSKFQLAGVRRFKGVREHPNRFTHSLTDWCFDREISDRNRVYLRCTLICLQHLIIVLSLLLSVGQELVLKYLANTVCKQKITLVLKYDIGGYDILTGSQMNSLTEGLTGETT